MALAGIFLAIGQVRRIATHGQPDTRRVDPCLRALLGRYEGDITALYGDRGNLAPGIHALIEHLENPREAECTGYLVGVLQLERRLTGHRTYFQQLVDGLRRASDQAGYFGSVSHPNVVTNLESLYAETVGHLRPRIIIRGEREYLEDSRNAALIRALLLSAVRAAAIWRQSGGSRWRLIVGRRRLIDAARALLSTV